MNLGPSDIILDCAKAEAEILPFIRKVVSDAKAKGAVLGLSGGIDSSVVGALCVRALGKESVVGILMPASHTPQQDVEDARTLGKAWGIKTYEVSIDPVFSAFLGSTALDTSNRVADANVKARLRMVINYYFANSLGMTVAGTGDRSEDLIGYFCYDEQTKVVTKDGPKAYHQLSKGDTVFSYDPSSDRVVEATVDGVFVFDYDNKMIQFRGDNIDLLVTPNHRMLIRTKGGKRLPKGARFMKAEDCIKRRYTVTPVPAKWSGKTEPQREIPITFSQRHVRKTVSFTIQDLFYIIGLFIGDGSAVKGQTRVPVASGLSRIELVSLARNEKGQFLTIPSSQQNPSMKTYNTFETYFSLPVSQKGDARTKLTGILEKYGVGYSSTANLVRIQSKGLHEFFLQCGHGAHNKQIPRWVLNYPSEQLTFLLRGLEDSDGNHSSPARVYYTSSEKLKDGFVELCIKLGRLPTVHVRPPRVSQFHGKTIKSTRAYEISYAAGYKDSRWITNSRASVVSYKGIVWCPSVPPHENVLVERNGRYLFCGNTKYGDGGVDFLPIAHLYKTQVRQLGAHLGLPERVVNKPASPQLWPGHKATDEIPVEYERLDLVLHGLFDRKLGAKEVSALTGVELKIVEEVLRKHRESQHKRSYPPMLGGW